MSEFSSKIFKELIIWFCLKLKSINLSLYSLILLIFRSFRFVIFFFVFIYISVFFVFFFNWNWIIKISFVFFSFKFYLTLVSFLDFIWILFLKESIFVIIVSKGWFLSGDLKFMVIIVVILRTKLACCPFGWNWACWLFDLFDFMW